MTSFSERLKITLEIRGLNQTELAKKAGLDKSLISNYVNGKFKARSDNLYIIAKTLNVSEAWLLGYDVPLERNVNLTKSLVLSAHEEDIIIKYRQNPEVQIAIDRLLGIEAAPENKKENIV